MVHPLYTGSSKVNYKYEKECLNILKIIKQNTKPAPNFNNIEEIKKAY